MKLQLHAEEKILLNLKPNKRAVLYFMISRLWHFIVFSIIFIFSLLFQRNSMIYHNIDNVLQQLHFDLFKVESLGVLLIILVLLVGWLYTKFVLQGYNYVLTNQRCILTYGFLSLNQRIIPYHKITDIDIQSSFMEKIWGLGSVYIENTATIFSGNRQGFTGNTGRLEGLSLDECSQVVDVVSQELKSS